MEKGTRQGCLLSTLFFIMVFEILLKQIREDKGIKGLKYKGFSCKLRSFGDDVIFILETFPLLLDKIKEFGDVAGFYINKSKLVYENISKLK